MGAGRGDSGAGEGTAETALGRQAAFDVVITMGCGDTCPVFPGKRYLD